MLSSQAGQLGATQLEESLQESLGSFVVTYTHIIRPLHQSPVAIPADYHILNSSLVIVQ